MLDGQAGTDDESVGEFVEKVWLRAKKGRVEVNTYDQYRWAVKGHIVPLIGKVRLRDLTPEILDDWVGDHRLAAAFHLNLVTGLRRGELLALRWSDVDLRARELTVHQQLAVERNRPVLKQLKTESADHVVTFGPSTSAALVRHRKQQDAERAMVGDAWQDSGLVFTAALGGWIDPSNFRHLMDDLVAKAGVPRITPKGLRHTAQSVGRVVVGDDKVMQERLGHADIGVTLNTYTHTVTKQHKQAGARIDKVFGPPPVKS